MLLAHEKFKEENRLIELPALFAIRQNRAEQAACTRASEEVLLIRCFIVGIAGREHHSFDAKLHHFIKMRADAIGIGAVEERSVGGDAEAGFHSSLNAFDGLIVTAFTAD